VHSPDRRYWWDGKHWQLAVSPDGRLWFDGTRWIPNPLAPPAVLHLPTRWTRPLQVAVIVLTLIGFAAFLWAAGLAASTFPTRVVVAGGVSSAQAAQLSQSFRASVIAVFVVNGVTLLAVVVLIVVGTLKRWRWMFWVTLVGFGLVLIEPLLGLVGSVLVPISRHQAGTLPPVPPVPLALGLATMLVLPADLLLFVWMLVTAVRIGPWACRRTIVEQPDHEPPVTG
jgi:hypothetical protein